MVAGRRQYTLPGEGDENLVMAAARFGDDLMVAARFDDDLMVAALPPYSATPKEEGKVNS